MNEYTVANAREIYCEIADLRNILKKDEKIYINHNKVANAMKELCVKDNEGIYRRKLQLRKKYPWYVRIWARLTYKL